MAAASCLIYSFGHIWGQPAAELYANYSPRPSRPFCDGLHGRHHLGSCGWLCSPPEESQPRDWVTFLMHCFKLAYMEQATRDIAIIWEL
jgi:hypothetical protein